MKITLAVLFLTGLTIYCKCVAVLSLPPSLIAQAAASLDDDDDIQKSQKPSTLKHNEIPKELQEQQFGRQQANEETSQEVTTDFYRNFVNLWPNNLSFFEQKRERNTFDDDIDNVDDVAIKNSPLQQQQQPIEAIKQNSNNIRQKSDLRLYDDTNKHKNNNSSNNSNNNNNNKNENMLLKVSAAILNNENIPTGHYDDTGLTNDFLDSSHTGKKSVTKREVLITPTSPELEILNSYLKPSKYWAGRCSLENKENCLQEYYGNLIADRNSALKKQLQFKQNIQAAQHMNNLNDDDIVLLLTAEQNLKKFLSWALSELYPFGKFKNASTDSEAADFYHPGMYLWKKLNLSGRVEPPLLVEEPQYVLVRRELNAEDDENDYKRGLNYGRDPFIPPRGRKHNLPDLDSLLHRYETFVPNRGRRDKIKDIFKYDDLFYPNRGKRQMIVTPTVTQSVIDNNNNNNGDIDDSQDDIKNYNEENANEQQQFPDPLLSANELIEYIENLTTKMKRKLRQNQKENNEKIANSFDEMMSNGKEPTKMSTTYQEASVSWPMSSSSLLNKRFKSAFNILHNRQQQQHRQHQLQQHLPKHYTNRQQWWKRYATTAATAAANNNDRLLSEIRSPTMATNRLQTLRSMSPQQHLTKLYEQQQLLVDLSPPHVNGGSSSTRFM